MGVLQSIRPNLWVGTGTVFCCTQDWSRSYYVRMHTWITGNTLIQNFPKQHLSFCTVCVPPCQVISIPVVDDSLPEPDESFTVTLSSVTGDAYLGPARVATVTIASNDVGAAHAGRASGAEGRWP